MPVKPGYLLVTAAGGIILYSGIRGKNISQGFRAFLSGQSPSKASSANPIAQSSDLGGGLSYAAQQGTPNPVAKGTYQAYALALLTAKGWAGQWGSFNNIVMAESGWNPHALNPSGAYGIAQALGHGTGNTAGNDPVNGSHDAYSASYGLTVADAQAANSGNGYQQLRWMVGYIANNGNFHDPDSAWQYHLAHNSY